jgi:hypothetical protein
MRTPARPLPESMATWMTRARYLRWLDAVVAWIALWIVIALALPHRKLDVEALIALVLLGFLVFVPPLRVRWRPLSAWVGLRVSRRVRPGDRAWWVTPHRSEPIMITARQGTRVTFAMARPSESEVLTVRRTRTFIVPAGGV